MKQHTLSILFIGFAFPLLVIAETKKTPMDHIENDLATCMNSYNLAQVLRVTLGTDLQPGDESEFREYIENGKLSPLNSDPVSSELNSKCNNISYGFVSTTPDIDVGDKTINIEGSKLQASLNSVVKPCFDDYQMMETLSGLFSDDVPLKNKEAANYYLNGHLILSNDEDKFTMRKSIQCSEVTDGIVFLSWNKMMIEAFVKVISNAVTKIGTEIVEEVIPSIIDQAINPKGTTEP